MGYRASIVYACLKPQPSILNPFSQLALTKTRRADLVCQRGRLARRTWPGPPAPAPRGTSRACTLTVLYAALTVLYAALTALYAALTVLYTALTVLYLVVSEEGSKVLLARLREDREVAAVDHLLAEPPPFSHQVPELLSGVGFGFRGIYIYIYI